MASCEYGLMEGVYTVLAPPIGLNGLSPSWGALPCGGTALAGMSTCQDSQPGWLRGVQKALQRRELVTRLTGRSPRGGSL